MIATELIEYVPFENRCGATKDQLGSKNVSDEDRIVRNTFRSSFYTSLLFLSRPSLSLPFSLLLLISWVSFSFSSASLLCFSYLLFSSRPFRTLSLRFSKLLLSYFSFLSSLPSLTLFLPAMLHPHAAPGVWKEAHSPNVVLHYKAPYAVSISHEKPHPLHLSLFLVLVVLLLLLPLLESLSRHQQTKEKIPNHSSTKRAYRYSVDWYRVPKVHHDVERIDS